METKLFMGCDIAQDTFSFCLRDQSQVLCQGEVPNSKKSIQTWLNELKKVYHVDLTSVIFWDDSDAYASYQIIDCVC
jgi:hypothetical protein